MADELENRHIALKLWYDEMLKNGNLETLKFRPSDVLILGPPKSGTTWLQQILHQIRTGGDESFADIYDITKICPMYITSIPGYQIDGEQKSNPRIFKGHSNYESIPKVDGMKFVVVLRDPLDAIWSFVKFGTRFYGQDQDMTTAEIQEMYKSPLFNFVNPWDFIANWFPHRNDPNVLLLYYEDLIKDLKLSIRRLSEFIGRPLSEEKIEHVSHFCTFEYMSSHKEKFAGGEWLEALMSLSSNPSQWHSQLGMVRPNGGKVGQGVQLMPAEMKNFVLTSWAETAGKSLGCKSYEQLYEQHSVLRK